MCEDDSAFIRCPPNFQENDRAWHQCAKNLRIDFVLDGDREDDGFKRFAVSLLKPNASWSAVKRNFASGEISSAKGTVPGVLRRGILFVGDSWYFEVRRKWIDFVARLTSGEGGDFLRGKKSNSDFPWEITILYYI